MKDVLRIATFRRLLGAWTIGNLADSALFLTLAVWAKDISGSSGAAGLVFLALGAPALAAPLLGLLADRVRRRSLLIVANLAGAVVAASLVLVNGPGDLWMLYLVAFAYGALGILNGSAQSGLLRDLLPDEHLDNANALLSTIDQGLRIITPAIGAGLYVLWGGGALGLGVAAILVLTALALLTVRVVESTPEPAEDRAGFWAEAAAGFRHVASVPLLARIVLVTAVAFGVLGVFESALFEVVEKGLGMEAAFFGVLMSIQGGAAIVGGLTSATALRRLGPARTVGVALLGLGLAACGLAADLLPVPLLPVAVVAIAISGICVPWLVVALITTRQRLTPPRLQGRTAAATNLAMTLPQLASIAAGAALITVVDYRLVMVSAGVVLLGCAAVLVLGRTSGPTEIATTDATTDPSDPSPEPAGPDELPGLAA
ncbi:MFS transporter [Occultella glacieicola]|uniref:MFS transporter n=1 Tax=Occultella glacieicola TaxID=2518684 RepID=A0ABY2E834_9MICO|nr:MFS transporter [Occultella glacieicola]TDE94036.1 MFS transporter [Occultella glacieicola]